MPLEAVAPTASAVARSLAHAEDMGKWGDELAEPSRLFLIGGLLAASARAAPYGEQERPQVVTELLDAKKSPSFLSRLACRAGSWLTCW
jgi:hypothetical protein